MTSVESRVDNKSSWLLRMRDAGCGMRGGWLVASDQLQSMSLRVVQAMLRELSASQEFSRSWIDGWRENALDCRPREARSVVMQRFMRRQAEVSSGWRR